MVSALTIGRLYCGVLYFVEGWSEVAGLSAVSSREKIRSCKFTH
jgi:uncharacterized membrane protein YphA (DoxX/SURF4 family)